MVSGLEVPVIDYPVAIIDYPTIDVPTEQEFRGQLGPPPQQPDRRSGTHRGDKRLTCTNGTSAPETPQPTITIAGVEAPLPEPAPLITAGATAVVTTAVTLTAGILVGKFKEAILEPALKRMEANKGKKKKKIKIKKVKPVLHYVLNEEGEVDVLEYSQKGTKVVGHTE